MTVSISCKNIERKSKILNTTIIQTDKIVYVQNIVGKANTNNESIFGIFVRFEVNILETQIIREWIDSLVTVKRLV